MAGPVQTSIERKLREAFEPTHLEVVNESYKHCVPKDAETHFKVVVVSEKFGGVLLLERHRCLAHPVLFFFLS
jgi:BolA protein